MKKHYENASSACIDKIIDFFEENNFSVSDCGEVLCLEKWTNGGVDMIINLDKSNIVNEFIEYVDNFDVDEEIELHIQDPTYRQAFTFKESVKDFEDFLSDLEEVKDKLERFDEN